MKSNNFPDKELLNMPPDMEGVTRPEKDKKTKNFISQDISKRIENVLNKVGLTGFEKKTSTHLEWWTKTTFNYCFCINK